VKNLKIQTLNLERAAKAETSEAGKKKLLPLGVGEWPIGTPP